MRTSLCLAGRASLKSDTCRIGRSASHASRSGLGVVRAGRRPIRTSGLARAAARQRRPFRQSGTVDAPGSFTAGAIVRSSVSIPRVVEARLERCAEVTGIGRGSRWRRHRAAWRLIRYVTASSHQPCGAGTHSDIRVVRSVHGKRLELLGVLRFGCRHRFASARAAFRVARTSGRSRRWSSQIVHSKGRPTTVWSRRARRSCAIMSPRRAAQTER